MNPHDLGVAFAVGTLPVAGSALLFGLSARMETFLCDVRADRVRRRYLTPEERAQLKQQRAEMRARSASIDWASVLEQEATAARAKFRTDLLSEELIGRGSADLSAAQLVSEFRRAVANERAVRTEHMPLTTSGCVDGFPVVRQWQEQVEALRSEFDRRLNRPMWRQLSWREHLVLRRATFEVHDDDAQQLPMPPDAGLTDIALEAHRDLAIADQNAPVAAARDGLEWIWALAPMQMKDLFQHATGDGHSATPHARELHMLAMTLIFESNTRPANAAELLELCTPERLARAWGGEYDSTSPWTGAAGADHNIAVLLNGKQPVLPFIRAQLSNLLRRWAADPADARLAAIKAGITIGQIEAVSAGHARLD